ncbi:hypothetical protein J6590_009614 [Homalodisca vitripennis]|nr:hypothetical protein J6590_009614 [Homalodisca vitripennis]
MTTYIHIIYFRVEKDPCKRCIAVYKRHDNVIQYKESNCLTYDSLEELCHDIMADQSLLSMFRADDASTIPCPFKSPPYKFSYNRGSGDCSFPSSRIDSCTDDSKLLMYFAACPDVTGTESGDELSLKTILSTVGLGNTATMDRRLALFAQLVGDDRSSPWYLFARELSYRKPLPILRQRSKSNGLVDNVIAESRSPFSWCVTLLYFRVLPLHFSKHKNSTKNKLFIEKNTKLVFILDHTPPPKMRVPPAEGAAEPRADVNEKKNIPRDSTYSSWHVSVEELNCLATWKEGNSRYLVAKIKKDLNLLEEDSYRCFMYNKKPGSELMYQVAQSGDATCSSVTSPTEGSKTMFLTRGL